jgi:hypothetical protein
MDLEARYKTLDALFWGKEKKYQTVILLERCSEYFARAYNATTAVSGDGKTGISMEYILTLSASSI